MRDELSAWGILGPVFMALGLAASSLALVHPAPFLMWLGFGFEFLGLGFALHMRRMLSR